MRRYFPTIVIPVIGLLITAGAFQTALVLDRRKAETDFAWRAAERTGAIDRIIRNQLEGIHAAKAFLDVTREVDRRQFRAFVTPLLGRTPGIQALEWIPRVRAGERRDYEQAARADGFTSFTITERGPGPGPVAAGPREEYFPVFYVEPYAGNERALGFDLASDPARRSALIRARDQGRAVTTTRIVLVQETGDQYGTLTIEPRYRSGAPATTVDERRRYLVGFILGVSRVGDVLAAAMSYFEPVGIDVAIRDDSAPPGERLLAFHPSRTRPPETAGDYQTVFGGGSSLLVEKKLDVGGRTWSAVCAPTSGFLAAHVSPLRWVILCAGLLLTALCTLYFQILDGRRMATEALLEAERALGESESRYRSVFDNAPDAIGLLDIEQRRFVDINENFTELFKMSREDLLEVGPGELSPIRQPDGRSSAEIIGETLARVLAGENVLLDWTYRDSEGREFPSETRLVRVPVGGHHMVRGSIIDITERREADQRQVLLMRELDHRVKNNLATVLALATRTAASARSLDEFEGSFIGRVEALARLHELLADGNWSGVGLGEIVKVTLEPFMRGDECRVTASGDDVVLAARATSPVCMVLHELTTNAAKHGALSTLGGAVDVAWTRNGDQSLELAWRESGGPATCTPARAGLGLSLIKRMVDYELDGTVDIEFPSEGLACTIHVPLTPGNPDSPEIS